MPCAPHDANIIGQPDEVIKKIERLKTLEVEYLLWTTIGGVDALRNLAEHVMPSFA